MPGLRVGVVLGTRRLADLVGADTARSLLETSRVFDADEALRLGFVTAVGEEPGWRETIEACAASACELPRDAHQALLSRTIPDTRDADMAALVTSVSRPGLRRRIEAFLSQSRQGR
jgi:enoyl-CoA hydratase/carnithine racemase